MATAVLNPLCVSISGRFGAFVFYRRKKTQCVRAYVVPRNPNTASQRNVRSSFADAVKSWQGLSVEERYKYTRKAHGTNMSGYNFFISQYMKEKTPAKSKPETKHSFHYSLETASPQRLIHSVTASIFNRFRGLAHLRTLHRCREPA